MLNDYHNSNATFKALFSPHCGKGWSRTILSMLPSHTTDSEPCLWDAHCFLNHHPYWVLFGNFHDFLRMFTLRNRANWGDQGFVFEHLEPWQWKWWIPLMDVRHVAMLGMVESQPYCSGSNLLPSRMTVTCCCFKWKSGTMYGCFTFRYIWLQTPLAARISPRKWIRCRMPNCIFWRTVWHSWMVMDS